MNYDELDEMQKLAFDYGYQTEMEKLSFNYRRLAGALTGKNVDTATKYRNRVVAKTETRRSKPDATQRHVAKANELLNTAKSQQRRARIGATAGTATVGAGGYGLAKAHESHTKDFNKNIAPRINKWHRKHYKSNGEIR